MEQQKQQEEQEILVEQALEHLAVRKILKAFLQVALHQTLLMQEELGLIKHCMDCN